MSFPDRAVPDPEATIALPVLVINYITREINNEVYSAYYAFDAVLVGQYEGERFLASRPVANAGRGLLLTRESRGDTFNRSLAVFPCMELARWTRKRKKRWPDGQAGIE